MSISFIIMYSPHSTMLLTISFHWYSDLDSQGVVNSTVIFGKPITEAGDISGDC